MQKHTVAIAFVRSAVAPLDEAGADDISFLDNRAYLPAFRTSRAGASVRFTVQTSA